VAEIAGVALAVQLATDVNYLLWLPFTGLLVWLVIWRVRFESHRPVRGGHDPLRGVLLLVGRGGGTLEPA
jgi:manganese transport protein